MYNLTSRIAVGIAFCFLAVCEAKGQGATTDSNSLKAGAWAMQFGISGNFTLTAFQGSSIALQYHLSESNAVRAAITVNLNSSNGTDLLNQTQPDSTQRTASNDNSQQFMSANLVIQYMWYPNPHDAVHLYFGVGPLVSYSHTKQARNQNSVDSQQEYYWPPYFWTSLNYSSIGTQWGVGAKAAIGVEWFPVHWFSLRSEYSNALQYQWSSSSSTAKGMAYNPSLVNATVVDKGSSEGWALTPFSVSFGVSVYF